MQSTSDFDYWLALPHRAEAPFTPARIDELSTLAANIFSRADAKTYADLIHFCYFCRKSNLLAERDRYAWTLSRKGLGRLFHITPKNIPMNFLLSFIFGFLSGNSNFVKVPNKNIKQIDIFLQEFKKLKDIGCFHGQFFHDFLRDDPIIDKALLATEGALVWGGNETINAIRKRKGIERRVIWEFPDRFSVSLIDAASLGGLRDDELESVVKGFYNDSLLLDQNACSSPKLVIWIGLHHSARKRFWHRLKNVAESNHYAVSPVDRISRNINVMHYRSQQLTRSDKIDVAITYNQFETQEIEIHDSRWRDFRGSHGLFYEVVANDLKEVLMQLSDSGLQTVTCFGIDIPELSKIIRSEPGILGVDRIVPIGHATSFSLVWDGVLSVERLSRLIKVG